MAVGLHVFLEKDNVPTRSRWQEAITNLGFPATVEPPFDPWSDTGFRPVNYLGQNTGFEFWLDPSNEALKSYPHIGEKVGKRNMCATFRWGGDLNEMSGALAVAAALTKLADGIYYYPADDLLYEADEAIQATKRDLNLE